MGDDDASWKNSLTSLKHFFFYTSAAVFYFVKLCIKHCQKVKSTPKEDRDQQHDEKETKKFNENAQKWNSNLSIKTINSNGLK